MSPIPTWKNHPHIVRRWQLVHETSVASIPWMSRNKRDRRVLQRTLRLRTVHKILVANALNARYSKLNHSAGMEPKNVQPNQSVFQVARFYVLLLGTFVVAVGTSCGSSDSAPSTGSGGAGSDANACDPVVFAMLNAANSDAKPCSTISTCVANRCAADAVSCAGTNYAQGDFSGGICDKYYACVQGCKCDKLCVDKCDPVTLDCASCISVTMGMGCTLKCSSEVASCGAR